jgi:transcriptional repressor NrdR
MKCPFCSSSKIEVIDTRDSDDNRIRRRRVCKKCKRRFTTYEEIEKEDLFVIKKDGRREKFDRHKLLVGIQKSCEKRPISMEKIESIVNWIERKLRSYDKKEIKSSLIGELVIKKLREIDEVAYIRFASVYRSFTDIDAFQEYLSHLKKKKRS